ncbi:SRPBCC family protein [Haladaptatus sp. GCM10025707]|uniref:SRPBCC family protein n=1 Tax=unclassified Haladaptatus TaxID=2622732 RepID=UPI0023E88D23|nr:MULTISPECIES: SRPBCC family protein [unclassified Haladaptatus]
MTTDETNGGVESNAQRPGETNLTVEAGTHELSISRHFDAPRDRVFEANVNPEHIPKWWGPRRYTTEVETMDARPGGSWRFLNIDADGNEHAFHGVYHDVVPAERIVQTFEYEGAPGHVSMETATFEEVDGMTLLTVRSVFQSVADRDASVASGMEAGARETWDRLAELVEGKATAHEEVDA